MSEKNLQALRGTRDLLGPESAMFRWIEGLAWSCAQRYGFEEIRTPHLEMSDVFHRSLGETSDAVAKETYTFLDRGGDSITLRPEGTAGIARAFVSNGLTQALPIRAYYTGTMFRYERPQKGRYREFTQIGVELLGPDRPAYDAEVIAMANDILESLNLRSVIELQLNSLGDPESRAIHREKLVQFLTPFASELSPDSQVRLSKNPLRILDSKSPQDQKLLAEAPRLIDCWNDSSKKFFDDLCEHLTQLGIAFTHNPLLVRGFDYYTHTVFEFVTDKLGSQSAVLSGGRYNGLIATMGGGEVPGVGWGAGLDRLALLVNTLLPAFIPPKPAVLAVLPVDETGGSQAFKLSHQLRKTLPWQVFLLSDGQIGKRMKKADRLQAKYVVFTGGTEGNQGLLGLKNLQTGAQQNLPFAELIARLRSDGEA